MPIGASVAAGKNRPVMLLTSDSSFMFHISELETAARLKLPLVCVVGVDYQWGLEVGVYKRTFGPGSAETGVHWSKEVRFDKIPRASAVTANTSSVRRTSGRRFRVLSPAVSLASFMCRSTRRRNSTETRVMRNSGRGTPKACSKPTAHAHLGIG